MKKMLSVLSSIILCLSLCSCGLLFGVYNLSDSGGEVRAEVEEIKPSDVEAPFQEEQVITEEQENEQTPVYVVNAESYQRPVEYPGSTFENHSIIYPKLTGESKEIESFNEKLKWRFGEFIELLEGGCVSYNLENEPGLEQDELLFLVDYYHTEQDGIIGILIENKCSTLGSFLDTSYTGYYFDTNRMKELTFDEYLQELGIDYSDMIRELNKYPLEDDMGNPIYYSENPADSDITEAVFGGGMAYVSTPGYGWGAELVTFPY